jgi:hypothetical protein
MSNRKPFVCKKCGRTFSMPAHLARHSRVHAPARANGRPKPTARTMQSDAGSTSRFGVLVVGLRDGHRSLIAERDALDTRIAAIESALAAMGGVSSARSGKAAARGPSSYRAGSLKDRIQRVLSKTSAPMPIPEIAADVLRSGFKTKNKTLNTTVGIALAEMPGVRRVARGVYGMS